MSDLKDVITIIEHRALDGDLTAQEVAEDVVQYLIEYYDL